MKELQELIKRIESEIAKTPTGELRNLLCDANIMLQSKMLRPQVNHSLLERAMLTLDDYLNAGDKESKRLAAENARYIYKEYYGVRYVNRNERF
jgi:hypothetical protein